MNLEVDKLLVERESDRGKAQWVDDEGLGEVEGRFNSYPPKLSFAQVGILSQLSLPKRLGTGRKTLQHKRTPSTSYNFEPISPGRRSQKFQNQAVEHGIWKAAQFTAAYAVNLMKISLCHLHEPLAVLLCFYLLTLMAVHVSESLGRVFLPACSIPGLSSLAFCQYGTIPPVSRSFSSRKATTPHFADYLTLADIQAQSFEALLRESAGGSALSLEIKRAEMATSDLVARVRVSEMKSKEALARSLSEFIHDSRKTARGLQKLTSKVGGAVDK